MKKHFPPILPDMAGIYSCIIFIFLVRFTGPKALADGDTLWHIRIGETMLDRGELLTRDIFSHTAYGQPWIAHEWLAEVFMGALHRLGGLSAVTIFYLLLVALTFWLLFKIAERIAGGWLALLCVSITLLISMTHLLARPHIFTWFFGVLTLYLLIRNDRSIYLLIPVTALWSNFHGGVLLGPVLQGIFLLGSLLDHHPRSFESLKGWAAEKRHPLAVCLLSMAALGANPFGYHLIAFQFQVTVEIFTEQIGEWRSPDLQKYWYFRYYLIATILLLMLPRTRSSWTDRILLLFFINASLSHSRHMSLAALFLTPFWAENLRLYTPRWQFRRRESVSDKELALSTKSGPILTGFLAMCLLIATGTSAGQQTLQERFPLPEGYSKQAIEYLETTPPSGRMFNYYEWGDYLIYAFGGKQKVFIDGRADMYGEGLFTDYIKIKELKDEAENLLDSYEIDWVIFPIEQPLITFLQENGEWDEVYKDDQVAILMRKIPLENAKIPEKQETYFPAETMRSIRSLNSRWRS